MSTITPAWQEKPHILVVDDDDRLRKLLERFLTEQGFIVTTACDTEEAEAKCAWFAFDVMVLDVMMPKKTGIEWLKEAKNLNTPVLMLSALAEASNRIDGLEVGAEDYLGKPFEPKELVLRIQTILKRSVKHDGPKETRFGPFIFNQETSLLKRGDEVVALSSSEAAMLTLFADNANKPVSREALAALLPEGSNERSVDVQILRLRKKCEKNASKPIHLQTVRGEGYILYAE